MRRLIAVSLFFGLAVGNYLLAKSGRPLRSEKTNRLALVGGKIYPSPTAKPIADGVLLIEDGKIAAIGENGRLKIPADTQTLNCAGQIITAGFWNSHVHLGENKWEQAATIPVAELGQQLEDIFGRYGFTTVIDTGSVLENTKTIRKRIESEEVAGPRILTAGPILYPKGGTPPAFLVQALGFMLGLSIEVTDPDQAARVVAQNLDAGADATKIYAATWGVTQGAKIPVEVVRAITAESHKRGKLVLAHPSNADGLQVAIDGHVDVLLHTAPDSGKWDESLISRMKQNGIALVPTLKLFKHEGRHSRSSLTELEVNKAVDQLRVFSRLGGAVLFGTDVGYMDDYDPTEEYLLMASAGLSFADILASLTTTPAARFDRGNEAGRIAPGLDADIVVLAGDPASDVGAFSKVKITLRNGKIIYRAP